MAYYDKNGKITIDEDAAQADIKRLKQAITILKASVSTIKSLQSKTSQMKGETAEAILTKAKEMEKQQTQMIKRLEDTITVINKTLAHYKAVDEALKKAIQSSKTLSSAVTYKDPKETMNESRQNVANSITQASKFLGAAASALKDFT